MARAPKFPVGSRVQHRGSKSVGEVIEVKGPYSDGSFEYLIRADRPLMPGMSRESWWPSYHTRAEGEMA